jgi:hypothetical protein
MQRVVAQCAAGNVMSGNLSRPLAVTDRSEELLNPP